MADDHQNSLYYIIKGEGDLVEGILSEAEIVYYDNGSTSEVSMDSLDCGRVTVEERYDQEDIDDDDDDDEEDEETKVLEEGAEDETITFPSAARRSSPAEIDGDKRYKVIVKSGGSSSSSSSTSQSRTYRKTVAVSSGDDVQKSPCPLCNKMLTRVDEHIRLMHRNKVYICNKFECGAQFSTLKNLQSHQLTCYDLEKAYKCPYCFKEFHRKSNYKAHVRRHNSKKEFQCQLCESAFVDTTGLRRHFLKHHEPEREIFVSNCCGKRFKSKEGLKKHINRRICGIEVLQVVDPSPIEVPM